MRDTPTGLAVDFADYEDTAPYGSVANPAAGCGPGDNFVTTTVASSLARSRPHTVKLTMDFVDGPRNDVVKVYVDGTLRHTGGSWEDYYRWCTESGGGVPGDSSADQSRTVDSMIFQARTSQGGRIGPGQPGARDGPPRARGTPGGGRRRHRCARRVDRRRRARLRAPLLAEDLLDALRDVAPPAWAGTRSEQPPLAAAREMRLNRLASQLRRSSSLVASPRGADERRRCPAA
jgi:hypothetical protein